MSGFFGGLSSGTRSITSIPTTQTANSISNTVARSLALSVVIQPSFRASGLNYWLTTPRLIAFFNTTGGAANALLECEANGSNIFTCQINNIPNNAVAWDAAFDAPSTLVAPDVISFDAAILTMMLENATTLNMAAASQAWPINLLAGSAALDNIAPLALDFFVTLSAADPLLGANGGYSNVFAYQNFL